jgi:hypothetical protein
VARWIGLSELEAAFTKVSTQADVATRTIVVKAAAVAEKEAKANFEGSHKRGQPHVGGDKPNIVSGDTRRSIGHERVTRTGPYSWGTRIGPRTKYARRLELGGTDSRGVTTRPFPYFEPAVRTARAQFSAIAAAEWGRFLRL